MRTGPGRNILNPVSADRWSSRVAENRCQTRRSDRSTNCQSASPKEWGRTCGSRTVTSGELSATGSKLATDELTQEAGAERFWPPCVFGLFSGHFWLSARPERLSNAHPLHSGSECNPLGCGRTPVEILVKLSCALRESHLRVNRREGEWRRNSNPRCDGPRRARPSDSTGDESDEHASHDLGRRSASSSPCILLRGNH